MQNSPTRKEAMAERWAAFSKFQSVQAKQERMAREIKAMEDKLAQKRSELATITSEVQVAEALFKSKEAVVKELDTQAAAEARKKSAEAADPQAGEFLESARLLVDSVGDAEAKTMLGKHLGAVAELLAKCQPTPGQKRELVAESPLEAAVGVADAVVRESKFARIEAQDAEAPMQVG